jgi:UDP-N-acetylglucosamine--N-acetylmuramyl-(pentapeptide) pyrophosphoryl-undecaprenol N-acetylglucosamine transferase
VYPALAVHNALTGNRTDVETLWVGGEGGMEQELVKRAGISYRSIPAAGVHGVGLRALPGNVAKLARGTVAARRVLGEFRPDVLFFTGGYVAAPMAVAGRRIPTLLFVPDLEPGLALRFVARFADRIALTAEASRIYFSRPERLVVTGFPLRADLLIWSRENAARRFGLSPDLPVLLVTGGSKGARSINMAVLKHLNALLSCAQVIHISGPLDWPVVGQAASNLPVQMQSRYHALPYLHEMGAALAAADLVLSRAGASTLGEYPFFGLPAVLVPYPYAWRYQKVNADYLAGRGAAVILPDALLEERLAAVVEALFENKSKLTAMRAAMKSLSRPKAADAIVGQLEKLAGAQPS